MSNSNRTAGRNLLRATVAAAVLFVAAIAGAAARSRGRRLRARPQRAGCRPKRSCSAAQTLTVRPAQGARYQPLYKKGDPLPVAIRLNDGALLIEYHPASPKEKFQILTPLAIAAVRGTKWAMDVTKAQTSTLVLDGAVAVTNRRLNQYRRSHGRAGRRYHADRHVRGPENVGRRPGCGPFFPVSESEWRPSGRDLPGS